MELWSNTLSDGTLEHGPRDGDLGPEVRGQQIGLRGYFQSPSTYYSQGASQGAICRRS